MQHQRMGAFCWRCCCSASYLIGWGSPSSLGSSQRLLRQLVNGGWRGRGGRGSAVRLRLGRVEDGVEQVQTFGAALLVIRVRRRSDVGPRSRVSHRMLLLVLLMVLWRAKESVQRDGHGVRCGGASCTARLTLSKRLRRGFGQSGSQDLVSSVCRSSESSAKDGSATHSKSRLLRVSRSSGSEHQRP